MSKVHVEHLGKTYKNGVRALEDVSFEVQEGEFVSFIGMSGAGKTSLIRMLNGMLVPTSGTIHIDNQEIGRLNRREKRSVQKHIGTIYQDFCLVDGLTCYENVLNGCLGNQNIFQTLVGIFTKEQREYASLVLKQVGLLDKKDVKAKELSGGQKQRTAIARSMMQQPQILLADEPVASLDPYTSEQILELLKKLQKQYHLTVIINSHNVEASLKYSDRIIGIKEGRVVLDKQVNEVSEEELKLVYGMK
ncbi:MAG: phosphonate ABC transporter ATP-binding protein [Lachnospira sp.]|nr:phosphonate ABC transporter ATP-binding protein [Lachnospira sp.]